MKANDVDTVKKKLTNVSDKQLKKQDVVIADGTGSCRLVLWEFDVQSMQEGKSYHLIDVGLRKYGTTKYLSYTDNSSAKLIEDLEDVNEQDIEFPTDTDHTVTGDISAVLSANQYLQCKFCRSKMTSTDGALAQCTKCSAVMKITSCEQAQSAKFVVKESTTLNDITLSAFEPILSQIVDGVSGNSLAMKLLNAPPKTFRFNDRHVVLSFQE